MKRSICFVTGTRAEFGLMQSTLQAIHAHPGLTLQIVVTGMHLDRRRGGSVDAIAADGWRIDRIVPWKSKALATQADAARQTGRAMAGLADAFYQLKSDIVLVVGDRVEAFAAAAAGQISGRAVAHVHGGDRAAGLVDDSLRHAITKLSHIHFPATRDSARRIIAMGEDRWRVHRVGSPALDGIVELAARSPDVARELGRLELRRYAMLVLHPADGDDDVEYTRAMRVADAVAAMPFPQIVVIYPNNDPGSGGIARAWKQISSRRNNRFILRLNTPRRVFLGLIRDAAVLVGNSSSGIIEAASFGTPVINIGPRQRGRERGPNVVDVPHEGPAQSRALREAWNRGNPVRSRRHNIYGRSGAGEKIAGVLAEVRVDEKLLRKLIAY